MKSLYTAVGTATGRDGHGYTSDRKLDHKLSRPVEMGGDGAGTNPEQLFAVGYAACFASSIQFVADKRKLDVSDLAVTAEVGIGPNASGGFAFEITMHVEMPDRIPAETARELVDTAHEVCPYSNATRGNVPVQVVID